MIFVANLKTVMKAALTVAAASLAAAYWAPANQALEIGVIGRFSVAYGLTAAAFLAFPSRRRSDISLWVMVYCSVVEVVGQLLGRPANISVLMVDGVGVAAVMAPSWIEGLRRLGRCGDWTPIGPRRRRGDGRRSSPTATALSQPV